MANGDVARDAAALCDKASEVAERLKAGTWDSVQALALVSIAKSLVAINADRRARSD